MIQSFPQVLPYNGQQFERASATPVVVSAAVPGAVPAAVKEQPVEGEWLGPHGGSRDLPGYKPGRVLHGSTAPPDLGSWTRASALGAYATDNTPGLGQLVNEYV